MKLGAHGFQSLEFRVQRFKFVCVSRCYLCLYDERFADQIHHRDTDATKGHRFWPQSPAAFLAAITSAGSAAEASAPMRMPWNERQTKNTETRKKPSARMCVKVVSPLFLAVKLTANSTANKPNSVVNLITGFNATDEVSLNGSPTVSPTTVASCKAVPFIFKSTSTTFLALSQAPPALAIKIAWYRPKTAIEIR